MSDRELLEDAAKAAGMRVGYEPDGKERGRYDLYWSNVHHQLAWHGKRAGSEYPRPIFWNPLTDDGDALRLAVKLDLAVIPYPIYTQPKHSVIAKVYKDSAAVYRNQRNETEHVEVYGADPLAATRRAIVRAAAEIGRSMK